MRIERLAQVYEGKIDEELVQLAAQATVLTDDALTALRSELARRRIQIPTNSAPEQTREVGVAPVPEKVPAAAGVAEFVTETLRLYHRHFRLFFGLIVPAVAIGWFAIAFGRQEAREIVRSAIRGELIPHYPLVLIEIVLAHVAGMLGSWTAFALSFAGICVAVQKITTGSVPSVPQCFVPVRERLVAFLSLSTLLFVILAVLQAVSSSLQFGIFWALQRGHIHVKSLIWCISWGFFACVLLVLSRFCAAIPTLLLDNCGIAESILRSDAYTEGEWLILATLLAKSVIGGYIASLLPFWFAGAVLQGAAVPSWFHWVLTASSILAVSIVEPTMFIGFTLLYLQKRTATTDQPSTSEAQPGQALA